MDSLTPDLARMRDEVRELARGYQLDFYEVIFELVDYDELNMVASYGGFPTRYPHWRFGMEYEQLSKSYSFGLSKIYELVINNDPCYAYLMRSNSMTDQKLVMAHVYGHCDFFKNNLWFSKTPRKMMDNMANHGTQMRKYMDRHGVEPVEDYVDVVMSLDNLIDMHAPFIKREAEPEAPMDPREQQEEKVYKIASKDYMDRYINPPDYLKQQNEPESGERSWRLSTASTRDVLRFLLENAPLETWQQDILAMLREEAYYFAPQGMTKIMNEGWAVYWHSTMMTHHLLDAAEVISYADSHAGTLFTQPGQINPYKIGVELFRDIEQRWDTGKFGIEYQRCDDAVQRRRWNTGTDQGREKIFEVRKVYNDVSFVDEFITPEFAEDQKLYVFGRNPATGEYEIVDRDYRKVKSALLNSLTNFGNPIIEVADANFENRGELYLYHDWAGADLEWDAAMQTLKGLYLMWKRPVHIETKDSNTGKSKLLSFDGEEPKIKELRASKDGDQDKEVVGSKQEEDD
ncbi:MAG: SpoVR family protein [Planctomycetota bacterium]|jgi:stage V sporulation protein R